MITVNSQEGEGEVVGGSPHIKRHLDLQIKTLENATRDADKLERLLESKRRQKEDNF
jgi:hypothetical protein